jgi:Phospholipase_D-nuclease N-terminal
MPIAADYPFLDVLWTMILFFAWVAWLMMLFSILADVFGRRDIGGWAKAGWCVLLILVPFLGVLIYLVAEHQGIADRRIERAEAAQQQWDDRVRRTVAGGDGAAGEIERAEQLLAKGTISQMEFEELKAKAIAGR